MNAIHFIKEYIRHPRTVGAVMPSSKQLAKEMVKPIPFKTATCIVEYGPGTGVFTEEIIQHKDSDTIFLAIEANETFYQMLKEKYAHVENVYIIHDSAENIKLYLNQYGIGKVDYIVSGLPFTSLPYPISKSILQETANVLGKEGNFITFQYSKVKCSFFSSFFDNVDFKRVCWNVPPAYVFFCSC
ncbi:SAM-dependent methyltransferase [Priestia aryabhattai]|uniref:rRNA adenine N-6-methyltransferase family protein n=1 Tax=Priestia megaterium TaxID=1404 RepID=A0AAX6BHW6_PRIMG|nr:MULTISPECIES: rRNA adenine N-6-methyltransferase family protein [Priestia]MCA1049275.1 SAM-dependent methyltransferase [Priestia aryabhattai]MED3821415.1 rRNA adenine N-6-methyltransferase family protein [Priestia aryabhattai]NGY86192.1 SAM-dependent methyltransferase [Priestia megaterium]GMG73320.1 rRNA adenine N-6-methyltransferase family protein [Priestia megaterium]